MDAKWKVLELTLSSDARKYGPHVSYPFHAEGIIIETGERFSWTVPNLEGYDLSTARISDESAAFIGRKAVQS